MVSVEILKTHWDMSAKHTLKFCVDDIPIRTLSGSCGIILIMNENRKKFKRPTQSFDSKNRDTIRKEIFSFADVQTEEILYDNGGDFLLINSSPINRYHFLFVPLVHEMLEQQVCEVSLAKALQLTSELRHEGLLIGFNAPYAWASVNHLHYHGVFIGAKLPILKNVPFFRVKDSNVFYSDLLCKRQYKFSLGTNEQFSKFAAFLCCKIATIKKLDVSYNILLAYSPETNSIEVVLSVRKPFIGVSNKDVMIATGCIELSGVVMINSKERFDTITEEEILIEISRQTALSDDTLDKIDNIICNGPKMWTDLSHLTDSS